MNKFNRLEEILKEIIPREVSVKPERIVILPNISYNDSIERTFCINCTCWPVCDPYRSCCNSECSDYCEGYWNLKKNYLP
ncbi:MAG: hypothetical protein QW757_03825 [Candidatus Woesearchaeota archaeon]